MAQARVEASQAEQMGKAARREMREAKVRQHHLESLPGYHPSLVREPCDGCPWLRPRAPLELYPSMVHVASNPQARAKQAAKQAAKLAARQQLQLERVQAQQWAAQRQHPHPDPNLNPNPNPSPSPSPNPKRPALLR